MNCALFAKMDKVFSLKNKTLKKYWKMEKKYWKSQGKVREFCQPGKVGTLYIYTHGSRDYGQLDTFLLSLNAEAFKQF